MMDPNLAISVTLTAGQWQGVLTLLAEAPAPWKLTDPLMRAIQTQCMAHDSAEGGQNVVPFEQPAE